MKKCFKVVSLALVMFFVVLTGCKSTKVITPLYTEIDMNNVPDGIYRVEFNENDIVEDNGKLYITPAIYSEDKYDTIEIHNMKKGDTLEYGGVEHKIENVLWDEQKSVGCINGDSFENAMEELRPDEAGGTYYLSGLDDHHTYTLRGKAKILISDDVVLTDSSELGEEPANIKKNGLKDFIKNNHGDNFFFLNTTLRVENKKVVEINRYYIP